MDKIIKILKIVLLLIAIVIGLGLLGGAFFVYKGMKSGDLKTYTAKKAIETIAPDANLTPEQEQMLEAGDFEGLAEDIGENITPEQEDCAVEVLGRERAEELAKTQDPTPQEVLKLSKCL